MQKHLYKLRKKTDKSNRRAHFSILSSMVCKPIHIERRIVTYSTMYSESARTLTESNAVGCTDFLLKFQRQEMVIGGYVFVGRTTRLSAVLESNQL
jgi:hypothetical protein